MNSRVDCGIAWSEHRSQRPAGHRKTGIKLHVYCDSEAIDSVYEKAVSAIEGFKKAIIENIFLNELRPRKPLFTISRKSSKTDYSRLSPIESGELNEHFIIDFKRRNVARRVDDQDVRQRS